jgi:hypothetical protein
MATRKVACKFGNQVAWLGGRTRVAASVGLDRADIESVEGVTNVEFLRADLWDIEIDGRYDAQEVMDEIAQLAEARS